MNSQRDGSEGSSRGKGRCLKHKTEAEREERDEAIMRQERRRKKCLLNPSSELHDLKRSS